MISINKLAASLLTAALSLTFACTAFAYEFGWNIPKFDQEIKIQSNGELLVTETIVADFTANPRHGIIRSIPIHYRDKYGNAINPKLEIVSIKDESGNEWPYETSTNGDDLTLQIGYPDELQNQPTTYKITYKVNREVLFFKDHDELYWNVTGNQTPVPVLQSQATIYLPQTVTDSSLKATCYTGTENSTEQNCQAIIKDGIATISLNKTEKLAAYENLTAVFGFPKGIIKEPTFQQKLTWFLKDNYGYFLPIITLLAMYYLWHTRGRDPSVTRTAIMPYYEAPDKLSPSEVGTIIDESADMRDISATIIDLAVRGYLKIIETKEKVLFFDTTDYEFKKLKDYTLENQLKPHEYKILDAIFDRKETKKLSDLKNDFYQYLPGIKKAIYKELVKNGYFPVSPDSTRQLYLGIGIAIIMISFFGFYFLAFILGSISLPIGLIISAIIIMIGSNFMPAKTKKGAETYYKILGLEEYIKTAETDRLKFQEKENIFEKLLPYAMALNIADRWSKAFEGIYKNPPSWYQGSSFGPNFSTMAFYHSMNSLNSSMTTTLASSPRSASGGGSGFSGGFSGGGFGGGGVGSW